MLTADLYCTSTAAIALLKIGGLSSGPASRLPGTGNSRHNQDNTSSFSRQTMISIAFPGEVRATLVPSY